MRGMTTYSAAGCLSACTIAFLGGRQRVLNQSADLGFHQYSAPGMWQWQLRDQYAPDISMMVSSGVDRGFAQRVFTLESDDMWRPSHEELLQSGYVTAISDGAEFSVTADDPVAWTKEFSKGLQQNRLYEVLAIREPAAYADTLAKIEQVVTDQGTMQEVKVVLPELVAASSARHLPHCPDDAMLRYTRQLVAELEYLGRIDADACYHYLFPARSDNAGADLPEPLVQAELAATTSCIEGASLNPAMLPSKEAVSRSLQMVIHRVDERYGARVTEVLADLESPQVTRREACLATTALYREALSLPPPEAAATLRGMFAGS